MSNYPAKQLKKQHMTELFLTLPDAASPGFKSAIHPLGVPPVWQLGVEFVGFLSY